MTENINGKVVAITGASAGIGKAIAIKLASLGAKVVLGARSEALLKDIVTMLVTGGAEAVYLRMDVTRSADLQLLVAKAVEHYGRLDVIVNNAGIARLSRLDELDVRSWEEMIDSNIKGVLYGMAAAIPVFKQQNSGDIVNIISTSGLKIVPLQAVYAGTKNAVRTISEAFRQESDGKVRITGISPGYVNTEFAAKSVSKAEQKEEVVAAAAQMGISTDAVADAVVYAISQPREVEVGDIVIRPAKQN
jgi:NADP-dependent 3-hydroxy acid dehydrogenase YdfG